MLFAGCLQYIPEILKNVMTDFVMVISCIIHNHLFQEFFTGNCLYLAENRFVTGL